MHKSQFMFQHLSVGKKTFAENGSVVPRPGCNGGFWQLFL